MLALGVDESDRSDSLGDPPGVRSSRGGGGTPGIIAGLRGPGVSAPPLLPDDGGGGGGGGMSGGPAIGVHAFGAVFSSAPVLIAFPSVVAARRPSLRSGLRRVRRVVTWTSPVLVRVMAGEGVGCASAGPGRRGPEGGEIVVMVPS